MRVHRSDPVALLALGSLLALAPGCSRTPHRPGSVQKDLTGPALAVARDTKAAPAAPKKPEVDPKEQGAAIEALLPKLARLAMTVPERAESDTCGGRRPPARRDDSISVLVDFPVLLSLAATRAGKRPERVDAQGWQWMTSQLVWDAIELARGVSRKDAAGLDQLRQGVERVETVRVVRASLRAHPGRTGGGFFNGSLFLYALESGKLLCQAPFITTDKGPDTSKPGEKERTPQERFEDLFRRRLERLVATGEAAP